LEFVGKDKRIIYYRNESNLQLTRTLNKWIELSKGKYIARIDDDDIWCDKKKLENQVKFMENNIDYWLCWTWVILIDDNWKEIKNVLNRCTDLDIRNNISWSNQFAHSSIIIRKNILLKTWYYINENYSKYAEDYDLWLRIWLVSKFYNLETYSIKYRVREWSITWRKKINQLINWFRVYLKYRNNYPNLISWIISHIITIIMPSFFVNLMVRLKKSIRN
jgi:glycosyltransferase involved in cell wall biosynthesis